MIDPVLAAQADKILGLTKKRARRRRPRPAAPAPTINVTVNVPQAAAPPRRRHRQVSHGRPGQRALVANDRGREQRIAPSPG